MNLNNDDQTFLCAFRTYGWESRPLPESIAHQTGKALKLGYTGPLADLLKRLFDSYAVDVTTARCSYDYLYFPRIRQQVMDAMTNGWLLLLLQAGQVRTMQTLTNRFGSITGVVIRDEQTTSWMAPPDRYHEDWHDPQRTNLPNPDGQTVLIPAHLNQAHESVTCVYTSDTVGGQTAHHEPVFRDIDDEILRERCQAQPIHARLDRSWWWIGGDTHPHKEDLKAFGARWSRKRSQWYIRHADIPDDLVRMFDNRQSVAETLVEQGVQDAKLIRNVRSSGGLTIIAFVCILYGIVCLHLRMTVSGQDTIIFSSERLKSVCATCA